MKNILICLDILDIGGIETFVYNQALALKNKGYNVFTLSKKGILTEELKSKGINCIDFEFASKSYFDYEKIQEVVEIIEKYDINEVHINQFTIMNVLFSACIITNTPYIVYLHMASGIINSQEHNAYNWFEKQYPTYEETFKLLFKYAYKIIGITQEITDYTIKRYNIEDTQKCFVIPNSINFENYNCTKNVSEIKNFLIVSRFANEKINVIINGIKLYSKFKEKCKDANLCIAGNGQELPVIEKFINDNKIKDVKFLGKVANIKDILEKSDVLIGVDRCILEALAMKRLAVVSGYGSIKGLLKNEKTNKEIDENFCGKSLEDISIDEVVEELIQLNENDIKTITEDNYNKIKEKLDIENNIYVANLDSCKYKIDFEKFFKSMIKMNNILGKNEEEAREKIESNWIEHVKYKEWIEPQIEELQRYKEETEKRRKRWI